MTDDLADVSARLFSVQAGGPSLVRLAGELDMLAAPTLALALKPLTAGGGTVTLDLADLTFMDSTGINALCQAARDLGERGRIVVLNAGAIGPAHHRDRRHRRHHRPRRRLHVAARRANWGRSPGRRPWSAAVSGGQVTHHPGHEPRRRRQPRTARRRPARHRPLPEGSGPTSAWPSGPTNTAPRGWRGPPLVHVRSITPSPKVAFDKSITDAEAEQLYLRQLDDLGDVVVGDLAIVARQHPGQRSSCSASRTSRPVSPATVGGSRAGCATATGSSSPSWRLPGPPRSKGPRRCSTSTAEPVGPSGSGRCVPPHPPAVRSGGARRGRPPSGSKGRPW